MADTNELSKKWREKTYSGISSYTLMRQAPLIQEINTCALRSCAVARLRRKTGDRKFARVVDMGCGTGDWTAAYLDFVATAVGVDVNASFLELAGRRAAMEGKRDRLTLHQQSLMEFDDYAGSDLVCFGACLMYVDGDDMEKLFTRLGRSLTPDAIVYVRATVVKPLRRAYATSGGFYRKPHFYEQCFAKHGFEIIDSASSIDLILKEVIAAGIRSRAKTMTLLPLGIAFRGLVGFFRLLGGRNDYRNWILKRGR